MLQLVRCIRGIVAQLCVAEWVVFDVFLRKDGGFGGWNCVVEISHGCVVLDLEENLKYDEKVCGSILGRIGVNTTELSLPLI